MAGDGATPVTEQLSLGVAVRIQGLAKKPEYNGKEGSVKELCDNGRVGVFFLFEGDARTVAVKRENLVFLENGLSEDTLRDLALHEKRKKQNTAGSSKKTGADDSTTRSPQVPWSELVKDLGDLKLDEFQAQYCNLGPDGRKVIVEMLQLEVEKKSKAGYDAAKARSKIAKTFGFMQKRQAETDAC
eukprot:CAMPEP_0180609622 /NCGR_PEP_ID=MMETSP1037_2-20121125/28850_1 /TAXON_ID=632150 /ORGANISM="Azadinium spinosum, Strain 3D9" /LENGTH=185 /DNA_ID=CAMNT_0022629017 /DNA_START=34 /DNA_END=588 /DNA_ORIENTATION=+